MITSSRIDDGNLVIDESSDRTQLTAGATYIYNNPGADVLLLRLNDPAPAGAFFAGWDPNAIPVGASVITIHHPEGDLKKVSEGSVLRYSSPPVLGGATAPFSEVRWGSGTTEGGSSGAGLFTFDGSQYLLRGGLWGVIHGRHRRTTRYGACSTTAR